MEKWLNISDFDHHMSCHFRSKGNEMQIDYQLHDI